MDVVSEPTHLPALADTLPGMELTTVGLRIVDDDAIDWEAVDRFIGFGIRIDGELRFALGDAINAKLRHQGPTALGILIENGAHQATLADWMAIADKIPHGVRRPALSWTHHLHVAHFDEATQALWLDRAEEGLTDTETGRWRRWHADELRQAIKAERDQEQR